MAAITAQQYRLLAGIAGVAGNGGPQGVGHVMIQGVANDAPNVVGAEYLRRDCDIDLGQFRLRGGDVCQFQGVVVDCRGGTEQVAFVVVGACLVLI